MNPHPSPCHSYTQPTTVAISAPSLTITHRLPRHRRRITTAYDQRLIHLRVPIPAEIAHDMLSFPALAILFPSHMISHDDICTGIYNECRW